MSAARDRTINTAAADAFMAAMRNTANCVAIVATDGPAGRAGITVSSMVSVSADPPTLLVCINRSSPAHDVIRANRRFSINVLDIEQQELADRFAGRGEQPYEFDDQVWSFGQLPALQEFSARCECELDTDVASGTHNILVGRVTLSVPGRLAPLCYSNREYVQTAGLKRSSTDFVLAGRRPQHRLAAFDGKIGAMQ